MNWAMLDDTRRVIVDTARNPIRKVKGNEFFVDPAYANVLLDGGWQTVRRSRLKNLGYGSPFEELRT